MRVSIIIFLVFLDFGFFAQESYEFKLALPPEGEIVQQIDGKFFGDYLNSQTGTKFTVNAQGITMTTIIMSFVTKEQVRESSKLEVRNGYIFGIAENDSLPCFFEDEKYYFGIRQKINLNDAEHKAIIKKISDQSYILNFIESKGYSPSMIQFKNNTLSIKHFTYPNETTVFGEISKQEKIKGPDFTTVLLNPNQKEWDKLDKTVIFDTEILFLKQ